MTDQDSARVVAITGANAGIGYHMLVALLEEGYRVAALDVAGENVEALVDEHGDAVRYVECDVTKTRDVEAAIETIVAAWDGIDVFVNNAGMFEFAPFSDQTLSDVQREFDVNYFGYLRCLHAVLPHMLARGSGIVHNVSSGAGLVGHPKLTGYASTKGAVEALVRSLRLELRHEPVAVTLMQPALANTTTARELGYPESLLRDPAVVGRNLASKIERTDRVIYSDWQTRLGLTLSRLVPALVTKGTARFVEPSPQGEHLRETGE